MEIHVGNSVLNATLVDNSSTRALLKRLEQKPITVDMQDYAKMEKVGSLNFELPRNDERITTQSGDIILYQGSMLVIYYAPNTWEFTRLGKIDNVSSEELKKIFGNGNMKIILKR